MPIDDARPRVAHAEPIVDGADEVVEHSLRHLEVRDDAVLERPHRDDVGGRPADHALGLCADGEDLLADLVDRDDGGLVDDDAAAPHQAQGVRRAQVDADVVGEDAKNGVDWVDQGASLRRYGGPPANVARPIIAEARQTAKHGDVFWLRKRPLTLSKRHSLSLRRASSAVSVNSSSDKIVVPYFSRLLELGARAVAGDEVGRRLRHAGRGLPAKGANARLRLGAGHARQACR